MTAQSAIERAPLTAATPEQVDLVLALRRLADAIPALLPDVITGDVRAAGWSELADILYRAARLCREQVVIDVDNIIDAGGS
jgi:hypothetical protein